MTVTFFNWQTSGLTPGVAPYNKLSPNLGCLRDELGKRFGGTWLGGYGVRPIRAGTAPSSHGFGAAFDWRNPNHEVRKAIMDWLIANHVALGVQSIHDYFGCRIWHANRYPSQDPKTWWRPQVANPANGMGQSWAVYLHIETDRSNWANDVPIPNRLGVTSNPAPAPKPVVSFDPKNGVFGLYPLDKNKQTIRETDDPVSQAVADLTKYLQGVMYRKAGQNIAVDGDFGPRTTAAVKSVQQFFGLVVDGIVGPKTWAAIDYLASR